MSNTGIGGARDWSSGSYGSVANDMKDAAGRAADKARETVQDVAGSAGEAAGKARDVIGDAIDRATDSETFKAVEDFVRANPIPVLIGTAAAGALIAMAIANRKSGRSDTHRIMKDMSRYSDDLRREMRQLVNEDRISKLVNTLPTAEVSRAMSPWIAQVMEAMSSAKTQAKKAVADTAQTVHDRLA